MSNSNFNKSDFQKTIFNGQTNDINALALELFHYQYQNNELFRKFCDLVRQDEVKRLDEIPFLPIQFFKSTVVKTGDWDEKNAVCFTSSGTSGQNTSHHFVNDISSYENSFINGFEFFYGPIKDYTILALLPSYLEREGSSLIYMVNKMMEISSSPLNGFYLHEEEKLYNDLKVLEEKNQKTLLIGVSFALLDFAEKFSIPLKNTIIMETGGMKGRKKEITRQELHSIYKKSFGEIAIHSEYGMTELLSQAYSKGEGKFVCPPWMKIVITALDDPFLILEPEKTGRVNVIDLVNIDSVGFIATDDLGFINIDGSFEVIGRIDNSDLRGCNTLI